VNEHAPAWRPLAIAARLDRPAKLTPQQQQEVIRSVLDGSKTAADAGRLFGLHRSNITRLLKRSKLTDQKIRIAGGKEICPMQVRVRAQLTAIYRLQLERAFVIIPRLESASLTSFLE
jgi:hypothetical protein